MFPREKKNKKIQITSSELSYVFIWINVSYRIGDVNKRDCPPTTSTIPMPQLSPHPLGLAISAHPGQQSLYLVLLREQNGLQRLREEKKELENLCS